MQPARAPKEHMIVPAPKLGTVLDGRYQLVDKIIDHHDAHYVAIDLLGDESELDLFVTAECGSRLVYRIQQRGTRDPKSPAESSYSGTTMDDFCSRVALTGVALHHGGNMVFAGYDRKTGKPLRVMVIEEV